VAEQKHTQRELAGGRLATSLVFFTLGAANGSWIGSISGIQPTLRLNAGVLGSVLLAGALGGLAAMQFVPFLLRRFGHRTVLVPTLFSIAGSLNGGEASLAVARVGTIAFLGLLLGPALIGYTAHNIGIQYALVIPALLLAIVASTAHMIHWIVGRTIQV
jgi:hypothetical protein